MDQALRMVDHHPSGDGEKAIIYCTTEGMCREAYELLASTRPTSCSVYNGKMDGMDRSASLSRWMEEDDCVWMVATSAMGLGVDHPKVRWILHLGPAFAMEDYVQQCGRAGRDGKRAYCTLLWNDSSLNVVVTNLAVLDTPTLSGIEGPGHHLLLESTKAMIRYTKSSGYCLRGLLDAYMDGISSCCLFGASEKCGPCWSSVQRSVHHSQGEITI